MYGNRVFCGVKKIDRNQSVKCSLDFTHWTLVQVDLNTPDVQVAEQWPRLGLVTT